MSPERLWRLSAWLRRRGLRKVAFLVKKANSFLYHNSLPPGVQFSPDVSFRHHGFGTVIHSNTTIGRGVVIYQGVTIALHGATDSPYRITIEDGVSIGANSVILAPVGRSITLGEGARIGAGAIVTGDVPSGATVIGAQSRILPPRGQRDGDQDEGLAAGPLEDAGSEFDAAD